MGQSITNGFGQTIVQAQPNTLGGFIYSRSEYNDKGELTRQYQDTGFGTAPTAPTLYEYDTFGNRVKQTLALCDVPTPLNSPVIEMSYGVETAEDGVYSVATQTRYNAEGNPIPTTQKQLLSQLSATLASKSISVDARGNSTVQWAEHTAPAKVTSCSTIPGSALTAQTVSVDGFTTSMLDHAGITGSATRHFTETGMVLTQTDGRGNTTTTVTDIAGRTVSVTDAAGNTTTTAYCACCDNPAVVTDAMGNTSCYKYDLRGRKLAEWGTAIQPACFGYDDMGNMISLRTFRADGEVITTDPSVRSDYDETTWAFHATTGLEMSKTYADNTSVLKTYDAYNRLATETDARGNVKTHAYEHARGLHLGTTYTLVDGTAETAARSFGYNHLGQISQMVDDAGARTFGYNSYGERETDSLMVDGDTHLITEQRDSFGRSVGYIYSKNGSAQQTVTTGYGDDGRISSAGFLHGGEGKNFGYTYLAGTNQLQVLTSPNGMTLTQTYDSTRNLLTGMAYHRGSTLVAQRTYSYDILGRPTGRNTARQGTIVNDSFAHNSRSELAEATVSGKEYEYTYDNIGNRQSSIEDNNVAMYDTNNLNQYTSISENGAAAFVSQFDADGNQTLIKTETGTWSAVYNAENRPATFTNSESNTVVECAYDSMGRRAYKKVSVNGSVTLHQRYIYRGYLQIACIDLTRSHHPALWYITWDVTQPVATRPLAIQINGTWYTYGWDLTKNICELYSTGGIIATTYTYSPFGKVTATGSLTQPIQWSSEFNDTELGLVYYNWRYYNVLEGRWNIYDSIVKQRLYDYCGNNPIRTFDCLGLIPPPEYQGGSVIGGSGARSGSYKSLQIETDHIRDDFTRDQPEGPKKTSQILNNFDTEVKKHKRHYEHTGCKFVISYSREGNNPGEKFDTVAVLNKVKQVISNNLTNAIHIVDKHEYQAMNSALGEIKCICGIIFIGHAGSTDGPSRLIFDNATSIATETDSTNSGRYLYSSLNTENFVQNNLSLLLGCRSASDKRFSKVLKMEFEKEGKFISIAEALSQHFKGTVIGSYNKLNFDGGVPYTPSHAGGNDFRIFYNYIQ